MAGGAELGVLGGRGLVLHFGGGVWAWAEGDGRLGAFRTDDVTNETRQNHTRRSLGEGYFLNARVLYGVAVAACRRARAPEVSVMSLCSESMTAIVFSAAATEAFINQIAVHERFGSLIGDAKVSMVAKLLEIVAADASPMTKCDIMSVALTGQRCEKGKLPLQDFTALISLRNWILHMKPEPLDAAGVLRQLESRDVLRAKSDASAESQIVRMGTSAVAQWACDTAVDTTQTIGSWFKATNDLQSSVYPMMFQGLEPAVESDAIDEG